MRASVIAAVAIAGWMACGIVAAGGQNAYFRGLNCQFYQAPGRAATWMSSALGVGLIAGPIALFAETFSSGFYYYGWTLSSQPTHCGD